AALVYERSPLRFEPCGATLHVALVGTEAPSGERYERDRDDRRQPTPAPRRRATLVRGNRLQRRARPGSRPAVRPPPPQHGQNPRELLESRGGRCSVPADQVRGVNGAEPHRGFDVVDDDGYELAAPLAFVRFLTDPLRLHGLARPKHDHATRLRNCRLDHLGEGLARRDLPVPPQAPAERLQRAREQTRPLAVLACVAEKNVRHAGGATVAGDTREVWPGSRTRPR